MNDFYVKPRRNMFRKEKPTVQVGTSKMQGMPVAPAIPAGNTAGTTAYPTEKAANAAVGAPDASQIAGKMAVKAKELEDRYVIDPETMGIKSMLANYTSPAEEERLRKASVGREKILAIGDALRHIGNIYNTVNGAPSQKFNSPVEDERTRYLKGKALRDTYNQRLFSYTQAKAAQELQRIKAEREFAWKLAEAQNKSAYNAARLAEDARYHNIMGDYYRRQAAIQQGNLDERIRNDRERNSISASKGGRGGKGRSGGAKDYETVTNIIYNDKGKKIGQRTSKTYKSGGGSSKTMPGVGSSNKKMPGVK